jgi:integrase
MAMGRPAKPWFRTQTGSWYATVEGKAVSLGVRGRDNKSQALQAWHRLMVAGKPKSPTDATAITVAEVLTAFLADTEGRVQTTTQEFYCRFLLPFSERHGSLTVNRLTPALAEAYARKPTWSSSTRNDALGTLATAFRWAERSGLLERSPLKGLRLPPKESQGTKAVISQNDYRRALATARGDFRALLRFLWTTGCRPSEATALTVEAVDWANACVVLLRHKTAHRGKAGVLYLNAEALAVLTAQRQRHGTGLLFRTGKGTPWRKKVLAAKCWKLSKALCVRITAYGFRHTFATDALCNGFPDAQVAELLGHSGTTKLPRQRDRP